MTVSLYYFYTGISVYDISIAALVLTDICLGVSLFIAESVQKTATQ